MVREQIGDRLLLVGTAHVSPQSVHEVETSIAEFRPDVVAVELDAHRLEALEDKQRWESTPIHKLLKGDRLWLFLTQVMLATYQRRLGEVYGAEPGAEMLAGVKAARAQNVDVLLADRDVGVTMKRAMRSMRFREKTRLSWEMFKAMFGGAEEEKGAKPGEPPNLETLTNEDAVSSMMKELGEISPSVKRVVIDERDTYLATRIQQPLAEGKRVVAVVGAGHLPGIRERIQSGAPPADLSVLERVPEKRFSITKFIFTWGFLAILLGLFGYFAYQGVAEGNWDKLLNLITDLFIWGGGLAALGCLLARGHPYSIVTAFLVAPFTILHPGLAAGWFSGLVEAWVREPRVLDFQHLSKITTAKEFFNNRVTRVIMVAALTNIGAMIGASVVIGKGLGDVAGFFQGAWQALLTFGGDVAAGDRPATLILLAAVLLVSLLVVHRLRKRSHA